MTVVNMGAEDREFAFDGDRHVVGAGGGSVHLKMIDGQSIELVDQQGRTGTRTVLPVSRADGDPQLLPLYSEEDRSTSAEEL